MDKPRAMNVHVIKIHANSFLKHVQAHLTPQAPVFESWHTIIRTSAQTEEPSMATKLHIQSSISNTYQQYYIWQTSPG